MSSFQKGFQSIDAAKHTASKPAILKGGNSNPVLKRIFPLLVE